MTLHTNTPDAVLVNSEVADELSLLDKCITQTNRSSRPLTQDQIDEILGVAPAALSGVRKH